jgi:hypothetical protein
VCRRLLLGELEVAQVFKKVKSFYIIRRFIVVFTRDHHGHYSEPEHTIYPISTGYLIEYCDSILGLITIGLTNGVAGNY